MANFWDAAVYSQFLDLRSRPARDLLAALPPSFQPQLIYDLGCGPGNSTILLQQRWPTATVVGLDSSTNMLQQARELYPSLQFKEADISQFSSPQPVDFIFANASLHWLDHHEQLFARLSESLGTGGALAIQMPNNFHAPAHQTTIKVLQSNSAWQDFIKILRYPILSEPFYKATWYDDLLNAGNFTQIQVWETEYFQTMPNHQAIFEWMKGTALRPILKMLDDAAKLEFAQLYVEKLQQQYPQQNNGHVLFPFRRLFMIGFKKN